MSISDQIEKLRGERAYCFMPALIVILWITAIIPSHAQTPGELYFRPKAFNHALLTKYEKEDQDRVQDSIFFLHINPKDEFEFELLIDDPAKTPAKYSLTKLKLSDDRWSFSFETLVEKDDVFSFSFKVKETTAYRIKRTIGQQSTEKTIWLMVDSVQLKEIYVKDECTKRTLIPKFNSDISTISYDLFVYYDLSKEIPRPMTSVGQAYFEEFLWTLKDGSPATDLSLYKLAIENPPPLKPEQYQIEIKTITNKTLKAKTDEIAPIAVKPLPELYYIDTPDKPGSPWQSGGKKLQHEAPLYIKLSEQSQNHDSLIWTIRNDPRAVREGFADTLFILRARREESREIEIDPNIFIAGEYTAILQVKNNTSGCADTGRIALTVDSSLISPQAIPNVFSPNGDGVNDLFVFKEPTRSIRSIKDFRITILNRNGQKVYFYEGNPRAWPGWNGQRKGAGPNEPPGVYFFVIHATGWDGKRFRGDVYKGALHLFR